MTEEDLRGIIDRTEEKTILEHGFGAFGFQKSLEAVYQKLFVSNQLIPKPTKLLNSVIETLRNRPNTLIKDVITVLSELKKRGDGLILYTQGDFSIQFEKIARSGLAEYFHGICVVKTKNNTSLKRLQKDFTFTSGEFVVVGNSLRSDIEPSIKAGLKAVHFNNPNSWAMQNISKLDRSKYIQINKLVELLKLKI